MPTYYVHVPNTQAPTAEVEASNTKHARTAYLDYLSRNNLISWRDRQLVRNRIHIQNVEPGSIPTQIQLDYSAYAAPEQEVEVPQMRDGYTPEAEPVYEQENAEQPPPQPQPQQQRQPYDPLAGSPIADLSRRTGGF